MRDVLESHGAAAIKSKLKKENDTYRLPPKEVRKKSQQDTL